VDFMLENVNRKVLWYLNVFQPHSGTCEITGEQIYKPSSDITFAWPEEEDGNVLDSLVGQLQFL
jgi:hypothetical protein